MAVVTLRAMQVSDVTVDVEYEDLTNLIAALIVNNPSGRAVDFSVTKPILGIVPMGVGIENGQRFILGSVTWASTADGLFWPDGWGFQALVT
jgi:hypothetical protein